MKPIFIFLLISTATIISAQTDRVALKAKANACFEKNDYPCAETAFKQLVSEEYNGKLQAEYYNKLGIAQRRLGKGDAAFISFNAANKANPENIDTYINLSSILSQKGNKDKAIDNVRLGLLIDDQNAELYLIRAKAYEDLKKNELAEMDYKKVIGFHPENIIARSNYALFKKNSGRYTEALDDYKKMIAEKPESLLYNSRADVYRLMKNSKDALADVDKAIELDPKFAMSYITKAKILFDSNKNSEACGSIAKATALGYDKMFLAGMDKKCTK